ncbi:unnamed protein product [Vitrella brassicaformis CCMP3155]|uniref:RAVE complex protein Rav1 C-terminal domain-containing protein n=1 Tax=Vitrella brassicaformis (strain CCMP3155) TaxID=1169540 RepID=A0A0G4GGK1_VITBC|nr:unnamed protein product [Vitrella brassicaformis CCMP3155]|eukprot:CEM28769.1 unnamed protein product [Vitrella brassicaformis CCMP3155]
MMSQSSLLLVPHPSYGVAAAHSVIPLGSAETVTRILLLSIDNMELLQTIHIDTDTDSNVPGVMEGLGSGGVALAWHRKSFTLAVSTGRAVRLYGPVDDAHDLDTNLKYVPKLECVKVLPLPVSHLTWLGSHLLAVPSLPPPPSEELGAPREKGLIGGVREALKSHFQQFKQPECVLAAWEGSFVGGGGGGVGSDGDDASCVCERLVHCGDECEGLWAATLKDDLPPDVVRMTVRALAPSPAGRFLATLHDAILPPTSTHQTLPSDRTDLLRTRSDLTKTVRVFHRHTAADTATAAAHRRAGGPGGGRKNRLLNGQVLTLGMSPALHAVGGEVCGAAMGCLCLRHPCGVRGVEWKEEGLGNEGVFVPLTLVCVGVDGTLYIWGETGVNEELDFEMHCSLCFATPSPSTSAPSPSHSLPTTTTPHLSFCWLRAARPRSLTDPKLIRPSGASGVDLPRLEILSGRAEESAIAQQQQFSIFHRAARSRGKATGGVQWLDALPGLTPHCHPVDEGNAARLVPLARHDALDFLLVAGAPIAGASTGGGAGGEDGESSPFDGAATTAAAAAAGGKRRRGGGGGGGHVDRCVSVFVFRALGGQPRKTPLLARLIAPSHLQLPCKVACLLSADVQWSSERATPSMGVVPDAPDGSTGASVVLPPARVCVVTPLGDMCLFELKPAPPPKTSSDKAGRDNDPFDAPGSHHSTRPPVVVMPMHSTNLGARMSISRAPSPSPSPSPLSLPLGAEYYGIQGGWDDVVVSDDGHGASLLLLMRQERGGEGSGNGKMAYVAEQPVRAFPFPSDESRLTTSSSLFDNLPTTGLPSPADPPLCGYGGPAGYMCLQSSAALHSTAQCKWPASDKQHWAGALGLLRDAVWLPLATPPRALLAIRAGTHSLVALEVNTVGCGGVVHRLPFSFPSKEAGAFPAAPIRCDHDGGQPDTPTTPTTTTTISNRREARVRRLLATALTHDTCLLCLHVEWHGGDSTTPSFHELVLCKCRDALHMGESSIRRERRLDLEYLGREEISLPPHTQQQQQTQHMALCGLGLPTTPALLATSPPLSQTDSDGVGVAVYRLEARDGTAVAIVPHATADVTGVEGILDIALTEEWLAVLTTTPDLLLFPLANPPAPHTAPIPSAHSLSLTRDSDALNTRITALFDQHLHNSDKIRQHIARRTGRRPSQIDLSSAARASARRSSRDLSITFPLVGSMSFQRTAKDGLALLVDLGREVLEPAAGEMPLSSSGRLRVSSPTVLVRVRAAGRGESWTAVGLGKVPSTLLLTGVRWTAAAQLLYLCVPIPARLAVSLGGRKFLKRRESESHLTLSLALPTHHQQQQQPQQQHPPPPLPLCVPLPHSATEQLALGAPLPMHHPSLLMELLAMHPPHMAVVSQVCRRLLASFRVDAEGKRRVREERRRQREKERERERGLPSGAFAWASAVSIEVEEGEGEQGPSPALPTPTPTSLSPTLDLPLDTLTAAPPSPTAAVSAAAAAAAPAPAPMTTFAPDPFDFSSAWGGGGGGASGGGGTAADFAAEWGFSAPTATAAPAPAPPIAAAQKEGGAEGEGEGEGEIVTPSEVQELIGLLTEFSTPDDQADTEGEGEGEGEGLCGLSAAWCKWLLPLIAMLTPSHSGSSSSFSSSNDPPGDHFLRAYERTQTVKKLSLSPSSCEPLGEGMFVRGEEIGLLTSAEVAWGVIGIEQERLLQRVLAEREGGRVDWPMLRDAGVGFWVRQPGLVRQLAERLPRDIYAAQPEREKDPEAVALWYAVNKKKAPLMVLYKAAKNMKVVDFLSHNFDEEKWQSAAYKNAFALIGKKKYEMACAIFIVGGAIREALDVCLRYLDDPQLAIFLCRIWDAHTHDPSQADGSSLLHSTIREKILPYAKSRGDPWLQATLLWLIGEYQTAIDATFPTPAAAAAGTDTADETGNGTSHDSLYSAGSLRHVFYTPALPAFRNALMQSTPGRRLQAAAAANAAAPSSNGDPVALERTQVSLAVQYYISRACPLLALQQLRAHREREGEGESPEREMDFALVSSLARSLGALQESSDEALSIKDLSATIGELTHNPLLSVRTFASVSATSRLTRLATMRHRRFRAPERLQQELLDAFPKSIRPRGEKTSAPLPLPPHVEAFFRVHKTPLGGGAGVRNECDILGDLLVYTPLLGIAPHWAGMGLVTDGGRAATAMTVCATALRVLLPALRCPMASSLPVMALHTLLNSLAALTYPPPPPLVDQSDGKGVLPSDVLTMVTSIAVVTASLLASHHLCRQTTLFRPSPTENAMESHDEGTHEEDGDQTDLSFDWETTYWRGLQNLLSAGLLSESGDRAGPAGQPALNLAALQGGALMPVVVRYFLHPQPTPVPSSPTHTSTSTATTAAKGSGRLTRPPPKKDRAVPAAAKKKPADDGLFGLGGGPPPEADEAMLGDGFDAPAGAGGGGAKGERERERERLQWPCDPRERARWAAATLIDSLDNDTDDRATKKMVVRFFETATVLFLFERLLTVLKGVRQMALSGSSSSTVGIVPSSSPLLPFWFSQLIHAMQTYTFGFLRSHFVAAASGKLAESLAPCLALTPSPSAAQQPTSVKKKAAVSQSSSESLVSDSGALALLAGQMGGWGAEDLIEEVMDTAWIPEAIAVWRPLEGTRRICLLYARHPALAVSLPSPLPALSALIAYSKDAIPCLAIDKAPLTAAQGETDGASGSVTARTGSGLLAVGTAKGLRDLHSAHCVLFRGRTGPLMVMMPSGAGGGGGAGEEEAMSWELALHRFDAVASAYDSAIAGHVLRCVHPSIAPASAKPGGGGGVGKEVAIDMCAELLLNGMWRPSPPIPSGRPQVTGHVWGLAEGSPLRYLGCASPPPPAGLLDSHAIHGGPYTGRRRQRTTMDVFACNPGSASDRMRPATALGAHPSLSVYASAHMDGGGVVLWGFGENAPLGALDFVTSLPHSPHFYRDVSPSQAGKTSVLPSYHAPPGVGDTMGVGGGGSKAVQHDTGGSLIIKGGMGGMKKTPSTPAMLNEGVGIGAPPAMAPKPHSTGMPATPTPQHPYGKVKRLEWNVFGDRLLACHKKGVVNVWALRGVIATGGRGGPPVGVGGGSGGGEKGPLEDACMCIWDTLAPGNKTGASDDSQAAMSGVSTTTRLPLLVGMDKGHPDGKNFGAYDIALWTSRQRLVTGGKKGEVRIFDLRTMRPFHAFASDGGNVKVGETAGGVGGAGVERFDRSITPPLSSAAAGNNPVVRCFVVEETQRLVTVNGDAMVRVWDLSSPSIELISESPFMPMPAIEKAPLTAPTPLLCLPTHNYPQTATSATSNTGSQQPPTSATAAMLSVTTAGASTTVGLAQGFTSLAHAVTGRSAASRFVLDGIMVGPHHLMLGLTDGTVRLIRV